MYDDYVETLSKRFLANLSSIEVGHNFEYGQEFEVVMCKTLRSALPDRYGIARGFVVSPDNRKAGDDILVYERSRFPTLVLRERDDYSRKEHIPIEAAYCYIEAKHTLSLEGDDQQSLSRACEQVSNVKELCLSRAPIAPSQIGPYMNVAEPVKINPPKEFPTLLNPMFGVVIARHVRRKKGGPILTNTQDVTNILAQAKIACKNKPDILVLGENHVVLPVLPNEKTSGNRIRSPFFLQGQSQYHARLVEGIAFGIGLIAIMFALDWIQLGVLPWHKIIVDSLKIPYE